MTTLGFGLKVRGTNKAEIDRRVRHAAAMLGIEELLQRKPKQLSGGQMQRVALGRALVREPDVFLLDEPLSNLDAKMRVRMREEIAKLHASTGSSMIYVTHDQVEAMTLGDRIAVMRDGRVQQVGPPLVLYDRPSNIFVASFIGSPEMNLIEGTVSGDGQGPSVVCHDIALPLDPSLHQRLKTGDRLMVGLRPEHLSLGQEPDQGFPVEVELVEQMGAQTLLVCRSGPAALRALIGRNDQLHSGERVRLQISPGNIHLFEAESGRSLLADST